MRNYIFIFCILYELLIPYKIAILQFAFNLSSICLQFVFNLSSICLQFVPSSLFRCPVPAHPLVPFLRQCVVISLPIASNLRQSWSIGVKEGMHKWVTKSINEWQKYPLYSWSIWVNMGQYGSIWVNMGQCVVNVLSMCCQ